LHIHLALNRFVIDLTAIAAQFNSEAPIPITALVAVVNLSNSNLQVSALSHTLLRLDLVAKRTARELGH
jgi:hypothetical protein